MISRLHKTIVSLLLSCSVATCHLQADPVACNLPCEENNCYQDGYNWKKWLGSAVLVSAATGAVVAAAAASFRQGEDGKKGAIGPVGEPGPVNLFETDASNTLTFGGSLTTLLSPPFPAGTEGTFFVTSPSGQTTSTASIALDTTSGTATTIPSITVPAIFGNYTSGLEVRIPATSVASGGTLAQNITVEASNPLILPTVLATEFPFITYSIPAPPQTIQLTGCYDYSLKHIE